MFVRIDVYPCLLYMRAGSETRNRRGGPPRSPFDTWRAGHGSLPHKISIDVTKWSRYY